jgi:Protein of unknown function, DUF547
MITKRSFAHLAVLAAVSASLPWATSARAVEANPTFKKVAAGATTTVDHSAWDKLLKTYVVTGSDGLNRVAYTSFKKEHAALKGYVAALQKVDPATLDKAEQFAFWVNLYNAKTIDVVLDKYPVKSIQNISLGGGLKTLITGGPWQAKIMKVSGVDLTLDDVENTILRPIYGDNRVHYTVNCASVGCPNLATQAYTGAKLEAMLEAGAKAFINSPRGVLVEGDKIKASSIYDWFKADFGGSEATVIEHLNKYANPELKEKISKIGRIASYDYDWTLADAKK